MNQILITNNNNNYNKRNRGNIGGSNSIRKIIIFFVIAILVFAIAIISVYAYKIHKSKNKEGQGAIKPELYLEEIDNKLKIIAKSQIGINKIIYSWNNEDQVEMAMNGRTSYEETIDILEGSNTISVKVIDINNQETETSRSFTIEVTNKPIIETEIGQDAKLKITASSPVNTPMAYITYKWNDEEEVTVRNENEENSIMETIIDVKRGENLLTITAINSDGTSETITKKFNGVNNPIIEVTKNNDKLNMKISHDMGFKKIEFYLNGVTYTYDENFSGYDSTKKDVEYVFNLQNGENVIIIVATSTEGTQSTYQGKCDYTAGQ